MKRAINKFMDPRQNHKTKRIFPVMSRSSVSTNDDLLNMVAAMAMLPLAAFSLPMVMTSGSKSGVLAPVVRTSLRIPASIKRKTCDTGQLLGQRSSCELRPHAHEIIKTRSSAQSLPTVDSLQ